MSLDQFGPHEYRPDIHILFKIYINIIRTHASQMTLSFQDFCLKTLYAFIIVSYMLYVTLISFSI